MFLLEQWAWGQLSAPALQKIALRSYRDHLSLLRKHGISEDNVAKDIQALAKLGSWGRYQNNVNGDLLKFLGEPSFPKPLLHKVPVKRLKPDHSETNDKITIDFPIFCPHIVFSWYYHNDQRRFQQLFTGGKSTRERVDFWRELAKRKDPRLDGHPMTSRRRWMAETLALAVHGDGVPVLQTGRSGAKSFEAYSMQSVFASGPTLEVKVYLAGVFGHSIDDNTMMEVWRILCWSFYFLSKGTWPDVDWFNQPWGDDRPSERALAGQALAGGFCAVVFSLLGDLDHLAKAYKLRHYNANAMCELCPAHRDSSHRPRLYNNFDRDATWHKEQFTARQWRALYVGKFLHWLFTLPGVSQLCLEGDELHVKHLGTSQNFIGSVLAKLVFDIMPDSPSENMSEVWGKICEYYRRYNPRNQYTNLMVASFCDETKDHFPKLKGKGAEVKDVLPAVRWAWNECARGSADFGFISEMFTNLVDVQNILDDHREHLILPIEQADRIFECTNKFLLMYQKLAFEAEGRGEMLWAMPTKFHWLYHWAERARYVNPRITNTFLDEDFVGKWKVLVRSCSAGSELHHMPQKAAEKYRWATDLLGMKS